MQLQYRSIPYQFTASQMPNAPGQAIGKYRGSVLITQSLVEPPMLPISQRPVTLKYRGVGYQVSAHHS